MTVMYNIEYVEENILLWNYELEEGGNMNGMQ